MKQVKELAYHNVVLKYHIVVLLIICSYYLKISRKTKIFGIRSFCRGEVSSVFNDEISGISSVIGKVCITSLNSHSAGI